MAVLGGGSGSYERGIPVRVRVQGSCRVFATRLVTRVVDRESLRAGIVCAGTTG